MKFTKTHENLLIILIIALSFFFWESLLLFPVKLVSVILHEFAHVIAILCTGGTLLSVEITPNLGGLTSSKNTNELIVLLCGYPGSVLFGIVTYFFAARQKYARYYLIAAGLLFLLFGLICIKNEFGIISSVIISAVFLSLLMIRNQTVLSIILKTIALLNISYVINDIIYDTYLTTNLGSDAVRLEQLTGITDWVWGTIWIFIAVCALLLMIRNLIKRK